MLKRYWWTYIQKKWLTDPNMLYELIKEGNYIYFEYYEIFIRLLFSPNTEIEVRDSDLFIANYYEQSPFTPNFTKNEHEYRLDLDDGDFTYKIITEQEFNKLRNG